MSRRTPYVPAVNSGLALSFNTFEMMDGSDRSPTLSYSGGAPIGVSDGVRRILPFVLAFAVAPALFRIFGLAAVGIPTFRVADDPAWSAYAAGVIIGTLQDLSVGVLALGLVLLAGRFRRLWLGAGLGVTLFVCLHLYYLLDFLLFRATRIRMSHTFLEFFKFPRPFLDSAWEAGLSLLLLGSVFIVLMGVLFWVLSSRRAVEGVGRATARVLALFVATVVIATQLLPRTTHYAASNIVFRDLQNIVYNREHAWFPTSNVDAVAEYLTPAAENFERIDPEYPLLKRTTGFEGPTHFDVRLDDGERPHVVLLFLESFSARDVGTLGAAHRPAASPHFDRLSEEGVLFTNFYANGVQTTRAVIASLYGVLPRFSRRAIQSDIVDYPLIGLPELFGDLGYRNVFFHNGSLSFERKEDFFPTHGFEEIYGDEDVARRHPNAPRTSWGLHDTYLMEDLADWLADVEKVGVPGFITAFTVTNHHPWRIPDDFTPADFGVEGNEEYGDYLASFSYSDHALGYFADLLKQRGLSEKVVLFVLADTPVPMGERDGNYTLVRHLFEENVHIPFLIWAPGRLERGVRVEEVGSQVDLLPTMMDALGMTGLNHSTGTSLRRVVPERVTLFGNPFHLRLWGARAGRYKYLVSQAANPERSTTWSPIQGS